MWRSVKSSVNAQGGYYGNALQAASYGGHEAIAKLLIEKGADVNAQRGEYAYVLHATSYEGHEVIAKHLIQKEQTYMHKEDSMEMHSRHHQVEAMQQFHSCS